MSNETKTASTEPVILQNTETVSFREVLNELDPDLRGMIHKGLDRLKNEAILANLTPEMARSFQITLCRVRADTPDQEEILVGARQSLERAINRGNH